VNLICKVTDFDFGLLIVVLLAWELTWTVWLFRLLPVHESVKSVKCVIR
jgi:hypothetical protein